MVATAVPPEHRGILRHLGVPCASPALTRARLKIIAKSVILNLRTSCMDFCVLHFHRDATHITYEPGVGSAGPRVMVGCHPNLQRAFRHPSHRSPQLDSSPIRSAPPWRRRDRPRQGGFAAGSAVGGPPASASRRAM